MKNQKLIKCGDHSYAPWCVVCNHIINGTTKECVRVPMSQAGDGQQDDWLCPECFEKGPSGLRPNDIHCVCIHCARNLVKDMKQHDLPTAGDERLSGEETK